MRNALMLPGPGRLADPMPGLNALTQGLERGIQRRDQQAVRAQDQANADRQFGLQREQISIQREQANMRRSEFDDQKKERNYKRLADLSRMIDEMPVAQQRAAWNRIAQGAPEISEFIGPDDPTPWRTVQAAYGQWKSRTQQERERLEMDLLRKKVNAPQDDGSQVVKADDGSILRVPRQGDASVVYRSKQSETGGFKDVSQRAGVEQGLRKEITARTQEYQAIDTAVRGIEKSFQANTAAGDMSGIFAFMKVLDPTSVVREGEYANARNAGGVPDQVRNLYNSVLSGTLLSPRQREDFLRRSVDLAQVARRDYDRLINDYRNISGRLGVDERNVVPSTLPSLPNPQAAQALQEAREAIAAGAPRDAVIQRLQQSGIDPSGL